MSRHLPDRLEVPSRADSPAAGGAAPDRWATVPNLLCVFRLLSAPVLVELARRDLRAAVVVLFAAMALSDWLDGKIAIRFDQRSRLGPALDSVADLAMYVSLAVAVFALEPVLVREGWAWLALPLVAYLLAGLFSVAKFGRWPSHHTRTAKVSWLVMLVGAVALLAVGATWIVKLGMIGGALASAQSALITAVLPEYRTDVPSVGRAIELRGEIGRAA